MVRNRQPIDRAKHEPADGFAEDAAGPSPSLAVPAAYPPGGSPDSVGESSLSPEELASLLAPLPPEQSEIHLAGAIGNLLALRPIPWRIVEQLARMGKQLTGGKEVATKRQKISGP